MLEAADLPFVERLYADSRAQELSVTSWPEDAKRDFLVQQHQAQHYHYTHNYPAMLWLILQHEGEAVGRLYLDEWTDQFRVVDIAVIAEKRDQGFAAAVLEDIQETAAKAGKGVSIHVEKMNPARRLYERLGFTVAEDKGVYDLMEWGMKS